MRLCQEADDDADDSCLKVRTRNRGRRRVWVSSLAVGYKVQGNVGMRTGEYKVQGTKYKVVKNTRRKIFRCSRKKKRGGS